MFSSITNMWKTLWVVFWSKMGELFSAPRSDSQLTAWGSWPLHWGLWPIENGWHPQKKPDWRHHILWKIFCLAKVMPETCFWSVFGILGPSWAALGLEALSKTPKIQKKTLKQGHYESFGQNYFFFRRLNDPKRLGLGYTVLGKYPFGSNGVRFMGPKTHVQCCT